MQELTFEQVEEVSGGGFKVNFWQFILENMITTMGDGTLPPVEQPYFPPYPGEGLPPM
jgi:hypothetical protein